MFTVKEENYHCKKSRILCHLWVFHELIVEEGGWLVIKSSAGFAANNLESSTRKKVFKVESQDFKSEKSDEVTFYSHFTHGK